MPIYMYPTGDAVDPAAEHLPEGENPALAFLNSADNYPAIEAVTRTWDSFDLEEQANPPRPSGHRAA